MTAELPDEKILSVSVAAYNSEATLRETISSFVSDPDLLKYIEIIVVNDGSTDQTSRIAHEFESAYPDTVVVIDKENGGYGSTINSSLKNARGKYYRLVDGDDWVDSGHLRQYIAFLSRSDADIVISPYYTVREEKKLIDIHPEIPAKLTNLNEVNPVDLFFAMHEIAVRTENLRKLGLSITENCFYTDTEYNLSAFLCTGTIARFDQPVYCYRLGVNGQSMSLAGIRKHYQDMIRVSVKVIGMYQKAYFPSEDTRLRVIQNYIKHIVLFATYGILAIKDRKQSRRELVQYEKALKNRYPEAYRLSGQRKFLLVARRLNYRPFFLMRWYALTWYN